MHLIYIVTTCTCGATTTVAATELLKHGIVRHRISDFIEEKRSEILYYSIIILKLGIQIFSDIYSILIYPHSKSHKWQKRNQVSKSS